MVGMKSRLKAAAPLKAMAVTCVLTPLILSAPSAQAAGFQLREQSTTYLGNAFAGSAARANDIATIYYNPAGMAFLDGNYAQAGVSFIAPKATLSVATTDTAGGNGGDAVADAALPVFYGKYDLGDWDLGIAINSPFGLKTEYDDGWVGRYHAMKTDLKIITASPSVSYRINEKWAVAASAVIQYADIEMSNALNFGNVIPGSADGLSSLSGDDVGFGGVIGAIYQPIPTVRVGASWRTSVKHEFEGDADFQGVPAFLANNPSFRDGTIKADFETPDIVTFSAYWQALDDWAFMLDYSWTRWSAFEEIRVRYDDGRPDSLNEEHWNDSFFVSFGADYTWSPDLTLHMGVAFDQSPVPEENLTARIPDSNRYWMSLGASYQLDENMSLSAAYTHIEADSAKIQMDTKSAVVSGNVTGSYDSSVDIVALNFRWKF
jgi:long-chain fatty acid transport protein